MEQYKNILLAVELNPESDVLIIEKAKELCEQYNAQLTLLHTVEHLSNYGAAYGVSAGIDVEEILVKEARKSMTELGKKLNVPADNQLVKLGPAAQIILEEAKERNVDLIVIGSHGRHGIRLLLGSTANSVLHGALCDVLAVRLKE